MSMNFETLTSPLSFVVNGINWTGLTLSDCRACRCTNRRGSHGQPARSRRALSPAPWGGPTCPGPSPAPPPCRSAAPLPRCPWPPPAPTSPCPHPAAPCRWTRTPCTGAWEKPSTSSRPPTVLMSPSSSGIRCVLCGLVCVLSVFCWVWCGVECVVWCGVECWVCCVCVVWCVVLSVLCSALSVWWCGVSGVYRCVCVRVSVSFYICTCSTVVLLLGKVNNAPWCYSMKGKKEQQKRMGEREECNH